MFGSSAGRKPNFLSRILLAAAVPLLSSCPMIRCMEEEKEEGSGTGF
jgi:hypothetical protein